MQHLEIVAECTLEVEGPARADGRTMLLPGGPRIYVLRGDPSLSRLAKKEVAAHGITDSKLPDSLDVVALELDLAIRELRNSIFELTSVGDHDNLEQVVRDIAARASRILGFQPTVDVSGQVAGVPRSWWLSSRPSSRRGSPTSPGTPARRTSR